MSCCKKSRACDVFVSASLLRPLADPILHRAGNFALAPSPRVFILTKRRVLQFTGAAALNDFYSRVHRFTRIKTNCSTIISMRKGFCAWSFFLETLDSASGTLLNRVIAGLPPPPLLIAGVNLRQSISAAGECSDTQAATAILICFFASSGNPKITRLSDVTFVLSRVSRKDE